MGGGFNLDFRFFLYCTARQQTFPESQLLEAWPASIYEQLREGYLRKRLQLKNHKKHSQIKESAHLNLPSFATLCVLNVATVATSNLFLFGYKGSKGTKKIIRNEEGKSISPLSAPFSMKNIIYSHTYRLTLLQFQS